MRVQDWPKQAQLAWAAGLFEGEGWLRANWNLNSGKYIYLRAEASIGMSDRDPLIEMQRLFGGTVRHVVTPSMMDHWKPKWQWTIGGRPAVRSFIHQIGGYMGARRQAQMANVMLALYAPDRDYKSRTSEDYLHERAKRAKVKACKTTNQIVLPT